MDYITEQLNLRIDKDLIRDFEDLAEEENLDRASLVKKILVEGLKNERLKIAVQKYVMKEISIEKASTIAKISIYEFIHTLTMLGISSGMDLEDYKNLF